MSHYFTDNADMSHNRRVIPFRFLGVNYKFVSDNGVFSKDGIDYGTQLLLSCIDFSGLRNKIVDLGCGYGVISIIVSNITNTEVLAIDVNTRAVNLTNENSELNKVKVRAIENDGLIDIDGLFSAIITNPPIRAGKETVYRLFDQAYEKLQSDGVFWVVIRKQQGALSAVNKLNKLFGECIVVERKKGFWILKAVKT